ncbi:MAG: hypothetical protein WA705_31105 [Candidatus Ozemobacteraceae bacterium]
MDQKQMTIEGSGVPHFPVGPLKIEIPDWIRQNVTVGTLPPWQRGR